jgi:2-polyprenyl-3-methyl-5-hydroxy-6-metoxy-1,4-benzoquinol methylase
MREANEPPGFSLLLHEYPDFRGRRVLDVGCGNGYVLSQYAREGAQVVGLDLTRRGLEISSQRFRIMGLSGQFAQGNAEQLPFASQSFDCVCSMGVLHHTPRTQKAIDEITRVLRPGGRLILMFYNKISYRNLICYPAAKLLLASCRHKSLQQLRNENDGSGNPLAKVYSKNELRRMLGGFEGLQMFTGYCKAEDFLALGRLIPQALLDVLARRLGWFLYVKGWR